MGQGPQASRKQVAEEVSNDGEIRGSQLVLSANYGCTANPKQMGTYSSAVQQQQKTVWILALYL